VGVGLMARAARVLAHICGALSRLPGRRRADQPDGRPREPVRTIRKRIAEVGDEYRYHAFVSYSRDPDQRLARRLAQSLRNVSAHWWERGRMRVFLDEASLTPGDGLDDRLKHALNQSAALILLASKNSATSWWVREEVEHWRGLGRREVLIAHTGEGIAWPLGASDFDWDRTHALSEEVFGGTFTTVPAWVDLARARRHPRLHAGTVRDGAAALASAILGVDKESLTVHERRRQRVRVATAAVAAATAVTTAAVSLLASNLATRNEQQARLTLASQLITSASQLSASQPRTSLYLALEAMHLDPGPQARQTLIRTLAGTHYAGLINLHQTAYGVAYSSSGNLLTITGSEISLWETRTRPMRKIATIPGTASSLSRDGRLMAVAGGTGFALWDITVPAHPVQVASFGHAGTGASVSLSPAGHILATFDNATIRIWDVSQPRHPFALASTNLAGGVADDVVFSPDGKELATAGYEESIALWDVANPRHITMLSSGFGNNPFSVAFSPDGHTLAVPSDGVYELQRAGPRGGTYNLTAANAADSDRTASLWNISDPRHPRKLSTLAGHTDAVVGVAFSPDGDTLTTTSADQTAILWDVTKRSQPTRLDTLRQHTQSVSAASFSPDGTMLATVSDDGTAVLWTTHRPNDLQRIATFGQGSIASGHEVSGVVFAANARTAVSYGYQYVTLWNLKNPAHPKAGAELTFAPRSYSSFDGVALSPDSRLLAVLSSSTPHLNGRLTLWKITDSAQFKYLTSYNNLANYTGGSPVFSHDGRLLAIPAPDYGLRLVRISDWDTTGSATYLKSGSDPFSKNDAKGYLTDIAFSPDDSAITAVSDGGPAYVWNLRHTALTGTLIKLPVIVLQTSSGSGKSIKGWAFTSNAFYMRTAGGVVPYVMTSDMSAISTTTLWDAADPNHLVRAATLTGLSQGRQEGGRLMATVGIQYYIWDITDPGSADLLLSMGPEAGPSSAPNSLTTRMTFSPDENLFAIADENSTRVVLFSTSALNGVVSDPIKTACLITGPFMPKGLLVSYRIGATDKKIC